jgi:hypothetical protein
MGRKRQMLSIFTMTVDDDGDLLVSAKSARGALTELSATLSGNDDLWHGLAPDGGR